MLCCLGREPRRRCHGRRCRVLSHEPGRLRRSNIVGLAPLEVGWNIARGSMWVLPRRLVPRVSRRGTAIPFGRSLSVLSTKLHRTMRELRTDHSMFRFRLRFPWELSRGFVKEAAKSNLRLQRWWCRRHPHPRPPASMPGLQEPARGRVGCRRG